MMERPNQKYPVKACAATAFYLLASSFAHADTPTTAVIVFGESLEPYVMESSQSGLELEIVRAALLARGIHMRPEFFSQPRLPTAMEHPEVDAVATVGAASGLQAAYSDIYIRYQDVAIAISSRHLPLTSVTDLAHYRVLAFSLAHDYLGAEFKTMTQHNPRYTETANQVDQNRLLYRGVVDVVIEDRRIFAWMDRQLAPVYKETTYPVQVYRLFPSTDYRMAFRSPALRDQFNLGLHTIEKNGGYQQIMDRYH